MTNAINIVSFDIPFPANYGGVIDVFYKIKYLHNKGIKVYLHCFEYGRAHAKELEALCEKVYYYKRKIGVMNIFSLLPYNVKSRQSEELAQNLLSNNYPILFEVLHTCYLLSDDRFKNRFKIYRHSNIEHDYYYHLSQSEKKTFKRVYLKQEAIKLKHFESVINHANLILAVNENDLNYFRTKYPKVKSEFIPSFHANEEITIREGKGDYILYNGNLSVSENYSAIIWLVENVFSQINFPVIIAGLNPPVFLLDLIKPYKHIQLIANVSETEMKNLIKNAHIHVLYTDQATGLKLKLLNVLFSGRFIICNDKMVEGTGLESKSGLIISNTSQNFIEIINNVILLSVNELIFAERAGLLINYSNHRNITHLLSLIQNS